MALRDARTNFSAGEVSDALRFRSDLVSSRTGLRRCRNGIPRAQGGVRRRAGTQLVGTMPGAGRLLPFDSGDGRPVMTVWSQTGVQFATAAGWVNDGTVPHALAHGYAGLPTRNTAQSADVMWLFHPAALNELRRVQAEPARFQLVPSPLQRGPFQAENTDDAVTIRASGSQGTVTLTASAPLFVSGHVDTVWRLAEKDWSGTAQWVGNVSRPLGYAARFDGRVYEVVTAGTTGPNPPRHTEGDQDDGNGVVWRYLHNGYGFVRILSVQNATTATAEVLVRFPEQVVEQGTPRWRAPAWGAARGWPVAGALYQGRLFAGGAPGEPFTLHASAIQGFDDFEDGTLDDMAVSRDLIEGAVSRLLWMEPGFALLIGTTGSEWIARPSSGSRTVTPAALETRGTTQERACEVPGLRIEDRVLFVDASRRRLLAHYYDFAADAYTVDELSLRSEHLLAGGIVAMAWAARPDRVLWLLRADGKVLSLTWNRKEQVAAFALHFFGDPVTDIAVMPSPDGSMDDLWLLVERGGETCVERMVTTQPHEAVADEEADSDVIAGVWYLDSAVLVDGESLIEVVPGLDHLEGRTVSALIDGVESPPLVVVNGSVVLPWEGRRVLVGLPYTMRLRTLPFDLGQAGRSLHGRTQAIDELIVLMGPFVQGRVRVGDEGQPRQIAPRGAARDTLMPELYEGSFRIDASKRTDRSDRLEIELTFSDAYPATVLGIVASYEE